MEIIYETTEKRRRWQDWLNLLLGLWLIAIPFLGTHALLSTSAWVGYIAGALIAGLSARALYRPEEWEEWLNAVIGLSLIAAPFTFGFSNAELVTLNFIVIGLCITIDAVWATLPRPMPASHRGHAHHT